MAYWIDPVDWSRPAISTFSILAEAPSRTTIPHMSTEVCVSLTLRMVTFSASTAMVHPSITRFSMTCPGPRAVTQPERFRLTPARTPVSLASG